MAASRLPNRRPKRLWGGWGSGRECSLCGKAVSSQQAELELEFAEPDGAAPSIYFVHPECFAAWDSENRRAESLPAEASRAPNASSHDGHGEARSDEGSPVVVAESMVGGDIPGTGPKPGIVCRE